MAGKAGASHLTSIGTLAMARRSHCRGTAKSPRSPTLHPVLKPRNDGLPGEVMASDAVPRWRFRCLMFACFSRIPRIPCGRRVFPCGLAHEARVGEA
ncbi:hypothetical protein BDV96DRAFT_569471 [Lophiotrema nucula]|uniref:Uncharacterized protein n=1 Tax=Lophiotrema nucula TaxID=690887 RepID=A0A6A5ZFF6_9PLEO|nr:hypothetical protein BDV96DRAFT_569471 [Lophiotrema nucula]